MDVTPRFGCFFGENKHGPLGKAVWNTPKGRVEILLLISEYGDANLMVSMLTSVRLR